MIRGAAKKKSQKVEKVHNIFDTHRIIWIFFLNLGKNRYLMRPLPFKPLIIAKTAYHSYLTDATGLFQSYLSHRCTKSCLHLTNISSKACPHLRHFGLLPSSTAGVVYFLRYLFCKGFYLTIAKSFSGYLV